MTFLFKIIYGLVHVLEHYCAIAVEVVYFLSLFRALLCVACTAVGGLYVYKTISDHVLVLCDLSFLYHIRNE